MKQRIRLTLAGWCVALSGLLMRLSLWLVPPVPKPVSLLKHRVTTLVGEWDGRLEAGFGEAKRHGVYAQLMKEFPAEPKRNLSFLIEQVMQERA